MASYPNKGNYHGIGGYFSLEGRYPIFGNKEGEEKKSQIVLFLGVILGSVCKVLYDSLTGGSSISLGSFVIALIASIVVFPQLYYSGGLNLRRPSLAHWALAFQNGFFWNVALDTLIKKFNT